MNYICGGNGNISTFSLIFLYKQQISFIYMGYHLLFLAYSLLKCLYWLSNSWQGHDLTVPSADLRQRSPNKPRLTLCERVIIKSQKLSNTEGDKSGEEKNLKEDTTDMWSVVWRQQRSFDLILSGWAQKLFIR